MSTPLVLWRGDGRAPVPVPQAEFLTKVKQWAAKEPACFGEMRASKQLPAPSLGRIDGRNEARVSRKLPGSFVQPAHLQTGAFGFSGCMASTLMQPPAVAECLNRGGPFAVSRLDLLP